jgi:hypothetical protein
MANFHSLSTATPWDRAKVNCPNPHGEGTLYLTLPEALAQLGAIETAHILTAVGYCNTDADGRIARINRTAWYEQLADVAFITTNDLPKNADTYRRHGPCDSIRYVPQVIQQYMLDSSDPRAPTVLLKKADLLTLLDFTPYPDNALNYEYPAMNDQKKAVEETLDMPTNLPALEAMPMKVVIVLFPNDTQEYHYFAPVDAVVGDHCVVYAKGANKNQGTFSIGHIERDSADLENRARSAILGTFNEEFAKHVQQRMDYLSAVKAKLQQKKRQFEETKFFEMMAESDPEAAELLKQLKQFRV